MLSEVAAERGFVIAYIILVKQKETKGKRKYITLRRI